MVEQEQVEHQMSAGGVVYRTIDGVTEIVLCGRNTPRQWSLPKGTPDDDETIAETALREVNEETGLRVKILQHLGIVSYRFVRINDGVRCHKIVHYFLMQPISGSIQNHDHEFDEVRWFPGEEAVRILHYANDASIVEKALTRVREESEIG